MITETYSDTQAVFTRTHLHCTAIDFTLDNMDVSKTVTETNRRIIILGKTGAGKSSLGNTIFGENAFKIDHSFNSTTKTCQADTRSVNGRKITLIDTPGFFDTERSEEELKPEIVRCITECAPGPHAFLIVLKVETFTVHEQAVINQIQEYFSEQALKYATVVFTHGDQLPEGQTIEGHVRQNKLVSDLVEKCGGRCFVIDNKYWNKKHEYRSNQFQVEELLKSIDKMVEENNGSCYTNEMLQAVEEEIQQEEEEIQQEEEYQRLLPGIKIREQAKHKVFEKLLIRLAGTATGVVLGAFFGVVVPVGAVITVLQESSEPVQLRGAIAKTAKVVGIGAVGIIGGTAVGGAVGGAAGGAALAAGSLPLTVTVLSAGAGAMMGGVTGYNAAEAADTPGEAAKLAAEAVKNKSQSILDKANDFMDSVSQKKLKQNQIL